MLLTIPTVAAGLIAIVQAAAVDQCPGYTAKNVVRSATGLSADLKLAGKACDAYGDDLDDLVLKVEYQTGTSLLDHRQHLYEANENIQILDYISRSMIPRSRFIRCLARCLILPREAL
jgi:hypothetical protein